MPVDISLSKTTQLQDKKGLPTLKLDPDKYRDGLDEFELTKEQENEMLQVLWNIMSMMVDMAWGVDSIQMFLPDIFEKAGSDSDKLLELNHTHSPSDNTKTAANAEQKESADDR